MLARENDDMITTTLSRFERSSRAFTYIDNYQACLSAQDANCHPIQGYMDGLIRQLRNHPNEPTGWSFATWKAGTNLTSNLKGANAIVLEYAMPSHDTEIINRLRDRAEDMGWAYFLINTETRAGNTISIVWPLTSSINPQQYARLASIMAERVGEYRLEAGSLAATHIITVHASTLPIVVQGPALDGEAEIKRTAKLYQRLNARKWERHRPAPQSPEERQHDEAGSLEQSDDGLFLWPLSEAERRKRNADELLASLGVALT